MSETGSDSESVNSKRLSRRRSIAAYEAAKIAEWLQTALRKADIDDPRAKQLANMLVEKARDEQQKADGRIVGRVSVKLTGHPLLEDRERSNLFLDESGQCALNEATTPVFALAGVAVSDGEAETFSRAAAAIKRRFFGSEDIVFHEPYMRNRSGRFYFRGDQSKQEQFHLALRDLVKGTAFTAFGVAIRKPRFLQEYCGDTTKDDYLPTDLYDLAINLLLERYVDFLASSDPRRLGKIRFESIGAKEDILHQAAYASLMLQGTQFVSEKMFRSWLQPGCSFRTKSPNTPYELADLVARELFDWAMSDCQVEPPYWDILSEKVYQRGDLQQGKFGFKVFPGDDIDEQVQKHRAECRALRN